MPARILIKVKQGSSQEESHRNVEKALKDYKNKVFKLKITQELRFEGVHLHRVIPCKGVEHGKHQAPDGHPNHAAHWRWQSMKPSGILQMDQR